MNAQLLIKHGNIDNYQYQKIEIPKANKNEVVVRVMACSINNTDIWTKKGLYSKDSDNGWNPNFKLPIIQGADISGIIYKTGNDNMKLIGKRVIVYPVINTYKFKNEIDIITKCKYLGSEVNGGYAQYCVVPLENIVIVPKYCKLNFYELASFPTAYMTALHMINRSKISKNDVCLVTGSSGGVGLALLQLLKLKKITAIGISNKYKQQKLSKITKCKILNRNSNCLEKDIIDSNNKLFDVVFDVVAGDSMDTLINILKTNGTYVCSGAISGRLVNVYWPNFYLKHLNLLGSMLATKDEFLQLCFMIFNGSLKPHIYQIFSLKDLVKAQEIFDSKIHIGKIILDCN